MDSKLQIISGMYRGRHLYLPPDARPTQNMAREALFNMLDSGIIDPWGRFVVWDAFAGSGALGLECLSRYPNARVMFTDTLGSSVQTVKKNMEMLGVGGRAAVEHRDAVRAINTYGAAVDLFFVDPPYVQHRTGKKFLTRLASVAKKGAIVVWEQEIGHEIPPDGRHWEILRDKNYGRARFLILRKKH